MGRQSLSREGYNVQRTRRNSQGIDFYEKRKGRSDSRGRPYFRSYYRRESVKPRSFSRDMRSVSRYGDRSRDRSRGDKTSEKRSELKDSKKECKNCIGSKCEECVKMRKNAKELNVHL